MVLLNHINSALTRAERARLNENWNIIRDAFLNVQRQFNLIMGEDIDVIIDKINEALTSSEANAALLEPLIQEAQNKLTQMNSEITKSQKATTDSIAATTEAQKKLTEIATRLTDMDTAIRNAVDATSKSITETNKAINATKAANTATTAANSAAQDATTQALEAKNATKGAQDATTAANEATAKANTASQNANTSATNANTATQEATTQATQAKNAAQSANDMVTSLQGYNIPISDFALPTKYVKNQHVRSNGSTYRAKVDTINNPLPVDPATSNTWFELVAKKGDKGDTGAKGATGATGPIGPIGPQGPQGTGVTLLGTKEKESELPLTNNTLGYAWLIKGVIFIWDGAKWVNGGTIQGPKGDTAIWSTTIDYIINANDSTQVTYTNNLPIIKPTGYTYSKELDTVEVIKNSVVLYPGVDYTIDSTGIKGLKEVVDTTNATFYIRVQRLVTSIDPSISKSTIIAALGYEPANATLLADTARQTSVLSQGVNVVSSNNAALADVEIEGRTLMSLGNSNLEGGKKYILADPKTKLITDGITVAGVNKFIKGSTTVSKATFEGKVAGSIVENPHGFYTGSGSTHISTNAGIERGEFVVAGSGIGVLDNKTVGTSQASQGIMSQHRFSFNIIEEIQRKIGLIPGNAISDKIQWLKENVSKMTANWYGLGSNVDGNKANFKYSTNGTDWVLNPKTHTSSSISLLTWYFDFVAYPQLKSVIDTNGFTHYLAYSEASDGVVNSTINTDYIELIIELKSTAQLDTRPKYIRVANFDSKVAGSTVENPHTMKTKLATTVLETPSNLSTEIAQSGLDLVKSLNGVSYSRTLSSNGEIAQVLFSFNLIEEVERNIGKIPRATVADKVAWLRDNISTLRSNWYGFGSSVGGNRANFTSWRKDTNAWYTPVKTHTGASNILLSFFTSSLSIFIQDDGFIHLLAYAEPSDGVIASIINTDYIDLEIEIKPTANFSNPKIPLYEVTDTEYSKALVEWNADEVMRRFPVVQGMQHIQGPMATSTDSNLAPYPTDANYNQGNGTSAYDNKWVDGKLEVYNGSSFVNGRGFVMDVIPGQKYTLSYRKEDASTGPYARSIIGYSSSGTEIGSNVFELGNYVSYTFTPIYDKVFIKFIRNGGHGTDSPVKFWDITFNLGSKAIPYVIRNDSYLVSDVKLGAIGNSRDVLFKREERWYLRKVVEKDLILSSSSIWSSNISDYSGYRLVRLDGITTGVFNSEKVLKHNGLLLKNAMQTGWFSADSAQIVSSGVSLSITISDSDSGWTTKPTVPDVQRYFNGWKYSDGVTWTSVTGNGQTATAQQALDTKPTDYTPYKLSYVLATPQVIDVTDKVEGALKLNGLTQVEVTSGVVWKEKAKPSLISTIYYINGANINSSLKYANSKILNVYKNGIPDPKWMVVNHDSVGKSTYGGSVQYLRIPQSDFDPTSEYTVSYVVLDKANYTANPTNVKLTYANSIRNALDDTVRVVQDNSAMLSIHERAIVDLYIKLKAMGGI